MCAVGEASSMWPHRSRRTLVSVTSTPRLGGAVLGRYYRTGTRNLTGPKITAHQEGRGVSFKHTVIDDQL